MTAKKKERRELLEILSDFRSFLCGTPRKTKFQPATILPLTESADPENLLLQLKTATADCTKCPLSQSRNSLVFGEGSAKAELMIIGEAPGEEEATKGAPFCGDAGNLLSKMLGSINLGKNELYITNLIKCRPPNNRKPSPEETNSCLSILYNQINIIRPRLICTLGNYATHALLQTTEPISQIRGKIYYFNSIPVIPTFHPAYLLRTPSHKREAWADLKLIRRTLDDPNTPLS